MAKKVQNSKSGKCVSPEWIDYMKHALSQKTEEFQIWFVPCTSERTKRRIKQVIEHENGMGKFM